MGSETVSAISEFCRRLLASAGLKFAEGPAFQFADGLAGVPLKPLAPEAAVAYFKSLVPTLGTDPQRFGDDMRREAFQIAVSTELELTKRVQGYLLQAIETGEGDAFTVEKILESAGVSLSNPQYSDMVFRTNLVSSFNQGTYDEMRDPDVASLFSQWRYDGINDARAGEDHRPKFGRYYPATASFEEVRGPRVWNCRCSITPIDNFTWQKLRSGGAQLESIW